MAVVLCVVDTAPIPQFGLPSLSDGPLDLLPVPSLLPVDEILPFVAETFEDEVSEMRELFGGIGGSAGGRLKQLLG